MRQGAAIVAAQVLIVAGVVTYADSVVTVPAHGLTRVVPSSPGRTVPACATDEGGDGQGIRPCVWDDRHMGHGAGHSFIARRDGRTVWISHTRAHALLTGRTVR